MEFCAHCGAKVVKYKHKLNKPLVSAMIRIYSIARLGEVNISELLSHAQVCNFQKLKYWDFVIPGENSGYWKLTSTAEGFIQGLTEASLSVWTYRGKRVDDVEETQRAFIGQILGRY